MPSTSGQDSPSLLQPSRFLLRRAHRRLSPGCMWICLTKTRSGGGVSSRRGKNLSRT